MLPLLLDTNKILGEEKVVWIELISYHVLGFDISDLEFSRFYSAG
jgi:hypothetical protein